MKSTKFAYQLVLVLANKAGEKEKKEVGEKLTALLKEKNLKVEMEHLGTKDLAYPIEGQSKGDFYNLTLEGEKGMAFGDINLFLNREGLVIRYLVLKN